MDDVLGTVENRTQASTPTVIDSMFMASMELAVLSTHTSFGCGGGEVVRSLMPTIENNKKFDCLYFCFLLKK